MEEKSSGLSIKSNKDELIVDKSEFTAILEFINFIRGRERGRFVAEVVTNTKTRYVSYEITNKDRIFLENATKV